MELEVAIDTPPLLKLTNLIPMTLSSGPTIPVLLTRSCAGESLDVDVGR